MQNNYENLPIFREALKLNLYLEDAVRNFPKYEKYGIGFELRENAREILYSISFVYLEKENLAENIQIVRKEIEKMKTKIYLAKELKALRDFKQFELLSKMAYNLGLQAGGWYNANRQNS